MIYLNIRNSQDWIKIPSSSSTPQSDLHYWENIHFNYQDYYLNFILESPITGNILIQNPNVKIIRNNFTFELIELRYKIHVNKGFKITCMLGSVYLNRAFIIKEREKIKCIWKSEKNKELTFGVFSPRGELSLIDLQSDTNDLKLIRNAVSSGFDLSNIYTDLVNEWKEVEKEKSCLNLPCVLRDEERFVKLKVYNFKFTPPKSAEIWFKITKNKKKLKSKAFDGKLKAYLKLEKDNIKIVKVVVEAENEEVLDFNKVQKMMTF